MKKCSGWVHCDGLSNLPPMEAVPMTNATRRLSHWSAAKFVPGLVDPCSPSHAVALRALGMSGLRGAGGLQRVPMDYHV